MGSPVQFTHYVAAGDEITTALEAFQSSRLLARASAGALEQGDIASKDDIMIAPAVATVDDAHVFRNRVFNMDGLEEYETEADDIYGRAVCVPVADEGWYFFGTSWATTL